MHSLGTGFVATFRVRGRRLCALGLLQATALAFSSQFARAQVSPPAPALPPTAQLGTPAEIQPGNPVNGKSRAGGPGTQAGSGPQSAVPAPLPPGTQPDTPGGRTSGGIAQPPSHVDPGMHRQAPEQGAPGSVIPPPGTPGSKQDIVPK